jgi:hypothetical protein
MQFKLIAKQTDERTTKTEVLIECYSQRRYRTTGTKVFVEPEY